MNRQAHMRPISALVTWLSFGEGAPCTGQEHREEREAVCEPECVEIRKGTRSWLADEPSLADLFEFERVETLRVHGFDLGFKEEWYQIG